MKKNQRYLSSYLGSLAVTFSILISPATSALANTWCSHLYNKVEILPAFHNAAQSLWRGPMMNRLELFQQLHPNSVRWIEDVGFDVKYDGSNQVLQTGRKKVLMISTIDAQANPQILADYLAATSLNTFSIPLPQSKGVPQHNGEQDTGHLFTRYGETIVDAYEVRIEFKIKPYDTPAATDKVFDRLEPIVELSDAEFSNLGIYFDNVRQSIKGVLGWFNNDGTTATVGRLDDNRPAEASLPGQKRPGHSCTTCLTAAPIGQAYLDSSGVERRVPMYKLLGLIDDGYYASNPGWLLAALTTRPLPNDRANVVVAWTHKSLTEAEADIQANGGKLDWAFNPYKR